DSVLSVYVPEHQGTDAAEFLRLAFEVFEIAGADRAVTVPRYFRLACNVEHLQNSRLGTAAYDVVPGYLLRILGGICVRGGVRNLVWEITVEKCVPHCFPQTYFALAGAVVGNEKSELRIRNQM